MELASKKPITFIPQAKMFFNTLRTLMMICETHSKSVCTTDDDVSADMTFQECILNLLGLRLAIIPSFDGWINFIFCFALLFAIVTCSATLLFLASSVM